MRRQGWASPIRNRMLALLCAASLSACSSTLPPSSGPLPPVADIPLASRTACVPASLPDIDFDTSYDGPTVDRKLGFTELPKMVTGDALIGSSQHPSYLGITIGDARVNVQIYAAPVRISRDVWCAKLQRAKVTIEWTDAIHLASELDPDSCADRLVRQTMAEHATMNHDALPVLKKKIDVAMRREARNAVGSTSFDNALALLRLRLVAVALGSSRSVMDELAHRQGALEQGSEADLVAATCGRKAVDEVLSRRQVGA